MAGSKSVMKKPAKNIPMTNSFLNCYIYNYKEFMNFCQASRCTAEKESSRFFGGLTFNVEKYLTNLSNKGE